MYWNYCEKNILQIPPIFPEIGKYKDVLIIIIWLKEVKFLKLLLLVLTCKISKGKLVGNMPNGAFGTDNCIVQYT